MHTLTSVVRVCYAYTADVLLDGVWEVKEEPVALEDGEGAAGLVRSSLASENISEQLLTRFHRHCGAAGTQGGRRTCARSQLRLLPRH